jgi:predicted alpha/beta hydrolase family esterase
MDRTLLIRHNWHDRDESKWLFWLEKKLNELGFAVSMAPLPEAVAKNTIAAVGEIQATHAIMPQNTYIVRHDPGCLTLLKYCEQLLTRKSVEPTLLVAGIPKRSYLNNFSVLKMIGGPKALAKREAEAEGDIPDYVPDPNQLTLETIDVKLMVVYGGELHKALR